jgi:hypothetical protein
MYGFSISTMHALRDMRGVWARVIRPMTNPSRSLRPPDPGDKGTDVRQPHWTGTREPRLAMNFPQYVSLGWRPA